MKKWGRRLIAASFALCAGAALLACAPTSFSPLPIGTSPEAVASAYQLSGTVSFPGRQTLITGGTLTDRATVTLFDTNNQAVAVGQTNAAGVFSLDPGTAFVPTTGSTYVLDAYKPIAANGVGADVARLRTVVTWTGSAWNSVSGTSIVINGLTTAVCVIQGLQAATVQPQDLIGTVSGASVTSKVNAIADQWSNVNTLVSDLLAKDQDPVARLSYADNRYFVRPDAASVVKLERFDGGTFTDTILNSAGTLQLSGPKPDPGDAASELDYFRPASMNNDAAGVVATDGTYLYVKAWSGYGNTTANAYVYKKIGTGYNGTTRGTNYGLLGTTTPAALSAFCWNGGIYQPNGTASQLVRIDTTTGAQTTVNVNATVLERYRGVPGVAHLLTTDGTYVYNLTFGIEARTGTDYNGFTVQVLNPANNFSLVRQFTMDTGSFYTDGVFCDGTYIYPIEWRPNVMPRLRRYRLSDGVREAEWTFPQTNSGNPYNAAANDPISGSWDPVNKVFWLGDLTNDKVRLLRGGAYTNAGTYLSDTLDSGTGAPHYGRLSWSSTMAAGTSLSFKVRSGNTPAELAAATWYGPTGTGDSYSASGVSLNAVHSKHRYLQVQATLGSTNQDNSPKLNSLSVEVLP